jgi:cell division protein YceG involved in septum cleavage
LLDQFKSQIVDKSDVSSDKLYNSLILASIVEREEKNSENKRVVAGILAKRLQE